MIWHPLQALSNVPGLTEVIIIGFYDDAHMAGFVKEAKREFPNIAISYLREYKALGTAGGLYHCQSPLPPSYHADSPSPRLGPPPARPAAHLHLQH